MIKRMMSAAGLICLFAGCSPSANDLGGKTSPQLSDKDNMFMTTASIANMTEIQISQEALTNSQSDAVKKFAMMMITDHQTATEEANAVGTSVGFAPPTMLDSDHQGMVDDLKKKMGTDFGKAYIDDQIKAHEATIKVTDDEANNGTNQQVKNLAMKLLPTLNQHLAEAKRLKNAMSGGM